MKITLPINELFFMLFPELTGKSHDEIVSYLTTKYTFLEIIPSVTIEKDFVSIDWNVEIDISDNSNYLKAVSLCENGKFTEAKHLLNKLIAKTPTVSDYYRILGQVLSEEGNQDEAIDNLITALRLNTRNVYALTMMGNIFAKYKDDVETAKKYYDQALELNPKDNVTLNNIGFYLMKKGNLKEAGRYFMKALDNDPGYANSLYALALISEKEGNLNQAFEFSISALRNVKEGTLYQQTLRNTMMLADTMTKNGKGQAVIDQYRVKLEYAGSCEVDIVATENIPYAAKIEFAENYSRKNHLVKYKPSYPAIEHLVVHELVHLDFVIQARKEGINQVFYTRDDHKLLFLKLLDNTIKNYRKLNIPQSAIDDVCSQMFDGINSLVYNVPIDLFIEDYINRTFEDLRPYQFLSLYNMVQLGIKSVTDKKILKFSDQKVTSWTKIFNLVYAFQFRDLFGLDLTREFQATKIEFGQAVDLYNEYLEYKDDRKPGEEYELVANWAEDLSLNKFFELEGEIQFRKRGSVNSFIESMDNDPLGIIDRDPVKERENKKFLESENAMGINMAVAMFMVSALQYFEGMDMEEIKKIAIEIALQGTQGYNPKKNDYTLHSIPDKTFSGYQILAFYYVSWALAIPEMLDQLNLPYKEEYKVAQSMYDLKK